jgi:Transglutaminase-like superfamily
MWKLFQRFRKLDREERSLFVRGSLLLPVIALSVRVRGFRSSHAMLECFLPAPNEHARPMNEDAEKSSSRTARMVRAAARYSPVRSTCLEQSLELWWLLGRRGILSSVRIGTRKNARGLEAHAWVECEGNALNEVDEPRRHYAAFDVAFPTSSLK